MASLLATLMLLVVLASLATVVSLASLVSLVSRLACMAYLVLGPYMTYGAGGWVAGNRLRNIFENWDALPDDDHPNRKVSKASILAAYS